MEPIEDVLRTIENDALDRGVHFEPPASEEALLATAAAIRSELGLVIPADYMRMLRVTNGIQTRRGYLSDLTTIGEQNAAIWFMRMAAGTNEAGDFTVRYEPLDRPLTPTYLWLGYDGNMAEQAYDLATGEYRRHYLGETETPLNAGRTLPGLLRHLVYGDDAAS